MNQPNKTELINKSFNMKSAVFRDITERPLRTPSITTHQSQPWGYTRLLYANKKNFFREHQNYQLKS